MEKYDFKKTEGRIIQGKMVKGKSFIDNRPAIARLSNLVAAIGNNPIQRAMHYGNTQTLRGVYGGVHWHYSYDDTVINGLHVTVCDTANFALRTWASRKSYTPTSTTSGTWSGWVNNHGATPAWALGLVNSRDHTTPAETAFHADANISTLLLNAFPPPPLNLASLIAWPPL